MLLAFTFFFIFTCVWGQSVRSWSVLGPFQAGYSEVEGRPKEGQYSELTGNKPTWKKLQLDERSGVLSKISFPEVDWQGLVTSTGTRETLRWQAVLEGKFMVTKSGTHFISCPGLASFEIDGVGVGVGDLYFSNSVHNLFSLESQTSYTIRSVIYATYEAHSVGCIIHEVGDGIVPLRFPVIVPDIVNAELASDIIGISVFNQNLHAVKVKVGDIQLNCDNLSVEIKENQEWNSIAVGQTAILPIRVRVSPDVLNAQEIQCSLSIKRSRPISFSILHRHLNQSFVFTFLDHDGSVGHAAAIRPLVCTRKCPVLLTLHGSSVKARDSVDAYKRMIRGKYIFGTEQLWTLGPTRHGAHNWEGTGTLTAFKALDSLKEIVGGDYIDATKVLFAGQSMGGHGCILAATIDPSAAIGIAGMAFWLRKDIYGNENVLWRFSQDSAFTPTGLKALLASSEDSFYIEGDILENLKHLPILLRVGEQDTTVHPWFIQRFIRQLSHINTTANITYDLAKGKGHWWWDTKQENDGGAVNDEVMRKFYDETVAKISITTLSLCNRDVQQPIVIYDIHSTQRNPICGWKILAPSIYGKPSRIVLQSHSDIISTDNVLFLKYFGSGGITIDSQKFDAKLNNSVRLFTRLNPYHLWTETTENKAIGLPRPSPIRAVANSRSFCISYTSSELEPVAVFLSNMYFMTTYTTPLVANNCPLSSSRVVFDLLKQSVYLNSRDRIMAHTNSVLLGGKCNFKGNLAVAALLPSTDPGDITTLVIATEDVSSTKKFIKLLTTPSIPPMARQPFSHLLPDYIIVDMEQFYEKGHGAYLAAGYWDWEWKVSWDSVWFKYCNPPEFRSQEKNEL